MNSVFPTTLLYPNLILSLLPDHKMASYYSPLGPDLVGITQGK